MDQEFRFDIHCHTSYSCDGRLSPEYLLKLAQRAGLGAIAITDHNTFQGVQVARQRWSVDLPLIIPGEEVSTEFGDIIGIFLSEEIWSRAFGEVIDEIHDQGGLSVYPHPLRRKKSPPSDQVARMDFIESVNSRTSHAKNDAAHQLAMELQLPEIAGSDSHFSWEIGTAWNAAQIYGEPGTEELRSILLEKTFTVHGMPVNPLVRKSNLMMSYCMKKIRTCTR